MSEAAPSEKTAVGRIGCPAEQEANVDEFYFWVAPGSLVEQTQIVRVPTRMGGIDVELYGVVEQVYRRSTISSMHMELTAHDGDPLSDDLPLDRDGVTYAKARVVNTFPQVFAPPIEGSTVFTCDEREAEFAYQMNEYADERGVCVGLIRNGGRSTAGRALLDQDFLLGAQAGHLNVNGAAGAGTKSSFLTIATMQTINAVKTQAAGLVGSGERPRVKAVIFNVKGFDLFYLDRWSKKFSAEDADTWRRMGVGAPDVFRSIAYYAPESVARAGAPVSINTPRGGDVRPYSWSLKDVVDFGLFEFLFSDEARANENLATLINIMVRRLTTTRTRRSSFRERLGESERSDELSSRDQLIDSDRVFDSHNALNSATFGDLLAYVEDKAQPSDDDLSEEVLRNMSRSTIQAFFRRLLRVLDIHSGLLRRDEAEGSPLRIAKSEEDVHVVDISTITDQHLQRFVIASVLRQLVNWRTGPHSAPGEIFLVVIDELNRYAPRGASDPITQLFEYVASQMRSRGIILFGAQQQGSRVSEVVIENSQTRVLGRSGGQELADPIWRGFSEGDRKLALRLGPPEKVIVAPNFREALHVKVPRPPWAMRPEESTREPPDFLEPNGQGRIVISPSRISEAARARAASFEP